VQDGHLGSNLRSLWIMTPAFTRRWVSRLKGMTDGPVDLETKIRELRIYSNLIRHIIPWHCSNCTIVTMVLSA
jgi:hypothetical protein